MRSLNPLFTPLAYLVLSVVVVRFALGSVSAAAPGKEYRWNGGGQCLTVNDKDEVFLAPCNGSTAQRWAGEWFGGYGPIKSKAVDGTLWGGESKNQWEGRPPHMGSGNKYSRMNYWWNPAKNGGRLEIASVEHRAPATVKHWDICLTVGAVDGRRALVMERCVEPVPKRQNWTVVA